MVQRVALCKCCVLVPHFTPQHPRGPLSPTRLAISTPVTRCSRTSWIWGLSPGAMAVRMTVSAFTWVTERTVAAVSQGSPKSPQRPPREPMRSRSRWKPEPLSSLRAFWLTMRLQVEGPWQSRDTDADPVPYHLPVSFSPPLSPITLKQPGTRVSYCRYENHRTVARKFSTACTCFSFTCFSQVNPD